MPLSGSALSYNFALNSQCLIMGYSKIDPRAANFDKFKARKVAEALLNDSRPQSKETVHVWDSGASFDLYHWKLRKALPGLSFKLVTPLGICQGVGGMKLDTVNCE